MGVKRMYVLLDSNVTAGYYLPRSLDSRKAQRRIENILLSIRSGKSDHFLYIPNFCIAEVFSVFMKHAFGKWNRQVIKKGGTIEKRVYQKLVDQFQEDIHNGKFIYHLELNRYHILGINLVAPIDHYYRLSKGKENLSPCGTFDHLILSMGITLSHIHGRNNVCIVSADDRLTDLLSKCSSLNKPATIKKLKLDIAKDVVGHPFSKELFPKCVNLKTAKISDLKAVFGAWPLEVGNVPAHYRWLK
jgi:hypothetical protein